MGGTLHKLCPPRLITFLSMSVHASQLKNSDYPTKGSVERILLFSAVAVALAFAGVDEAILMNCPRYSRARSVATVVGVKVSSHVEAKFEHLPADSEVRPQVSWTRFQGFGSMLSSQFIKVIRLGLGCLVENTLFNRGLGNLCVRL